MLKQRSYGKSIEALRKDYRSLRTGKVSTNILDGIKVDYYGTPTDLSQVGSVLAQMLNHHNCTFGKTFRSY